MDIPEQAMRNNIRLVQEYPEDHGEWCVLTGEDAKNPDLIAEAIATTSAFRLRYYRNSVRNSQKRRVQKQRELDNAVVSLEQYRKKVCTLEHDCETSQQYVKELRSNL
jgi:hypothetical protein